MSRFFSKYPRFPDNIPNPKSKNLGRSSGVSVSPTSSSRLTTHDSRRLNYDSKFVELGVGSWESGVRQETRGIATKSEIVKLLGVVQSLLPYPD